MDEKNIMIQFGSLDKSMRLVSCGYELILCDYTMSMLWKGYVEGYISGMKAMCFATFWNLHELWNDTRRKVVW